MSVTVDRTQAPLRDSELAPSALLIQHSLEYWAVDAAGCQRGADFLKQVCSGGGWVGHHMSGQTFNIVDCEPTKGQYNWRTNGNMRGLFESDKAGNLGAVPALAKVDTAKRVLVVFGSVRYQSKNPAASNYDWLPTHQDRYSDLQQTVTTVLREAAARGMPFHAVSSRQELKGQPDRKFGAGGGGQSEVDIYNAVRDAAKTFDPAIEAWFPHLNCGATRNLTDRTRPLKWAYDRDFLDGALARADGWERVMLDYANTDYGAQTFEEGIKNPDLQAAWVANWLTLCLDFWELAAPYFGPTKARALGFIEFYSLYVKLSGWADYTSQQKAAFDLATMAMLALGGAGPVLKWQPEGGVSTSAFTDVFAWFRKTAYAQATPEMKPLTGTPYEAGNAILELHQKVPIGTPVWPVSSGDQRVYGLATPTEALVVNLNSSPWEEIVDGTPVKLDPYTWRWVPASAPPSPPIAPADETVTWNRGDCEAVRADLTDLAGHRNSGVRKKAQHALALMPEEEYPPAPAYGAWE